MSLSPLQIYSKILPKLNCGECGENTCLAFATKVVSENIPLKNCPYLSSETISLYQPTIDEQHKKGKWTKRDIAKDALKWAKERASSFSLEELPNRIGGELIRIGKEKALKLPYLNQEILIFHDRIEKKNKERLSHWEMVFIYNHIAQGGKNPPKNKWIPFHEIPNTISKIKSMKTHVEEILEKTFEGKIDILKKRSIELGGVDVSPEFPSADLAIKFMVLPHIPVVLLFWDTDEEDDLGSKSQILFDITIIEHLDVESILFMCETLVEYLTAEK